MERNAEGFGAFYVMNMTWPPSRWSSDLERSFSTEVLAYKITSISRGPNACMSGVNAKTGCMKRAVSRLLVLNIKRRLRPELGMVGGFPYPCKSGVLMIWHASKTGSGEEMITWTCCERPQLQQLHIKLLEFYQRWKRTRTLCSDTGLAVFKAS